MSLQPANLEQETVYSLLSDKARRHLLWYLSVADRATISDAAERIATWKRETMTAAASDIRTRVTVQLTHNHLPRLSRYGIVNYDHASDSLEPGPNFERLEPYVSEPEPPIDPQ